MLALIKANLLHQFNASLKMLERSIEQCDADNWTEPVGRFPFWHVAYHTLYYTDLYLSPNEAAFRPRSFHMENYQYLGRQPWPPHEKVLTEIPYDEPPLIFYIEDCREKAAEILNAETEATLAGPSGFDWLPFQRLGTHLYNLRHIQHHTGQLSACLARCQGKHVDWVRTN